MLTGTELGKALDSAMTLKKVKQADVAKAFKIRQPSVSEWISTGRIGKKHIPTLITYFSDVVGPDHWGLPFSFDEFQLIMAYRDLPADTRAELLQKTQAASAKIRHASQALLVEEDASKKIARGGGSASSRGGQPVNGLPTAQVFHICKERETRAGTICDKDPTEVVGGLQVAEVLRIF